MALTFVSVAHNEYTTATSVVCNKPTGTADNDLMVAAIMHQTAEEASSAPSGWTRHGMRYLPGPAAYVHLYAKLASSEGADYTWTFPTSSRSGISIATYRGGFDTADIVDAVSDTLYNTTGTTIRAAAATATSANSPIIWVGFVYQGSSITFTPPTAPSSMTEDVDYYGTDSRFARAFASVTWTGSGSTGDMDGTLSASLAGGEHHAMALILNPSAGDSTAPVLTSATGTATGTTTATVGATTDEGNGTLYAVVTTSNTQPSVAQIKAGQTHTGSTAPWSGSTAVSSTGAKTLSVAGLTASTTYYAHLVHTDSSSNNSNVISSSSFATTVKKLKVLTHSSAASATGVAGVVFQAPTGGNITGTEIGEFTGAAFESSTENNQAVLKVAVSEFGGSSLTTSDTPVVLVRNSTNTTGIISATIVEE